MPKSPTTENPVKWIVIPDDKVNCIWECPECKSQDGVSPDWYQNNGTPMCCDCDCDMEYVRTEIIA